MAEGLLVLRTSGIESESPLAFAALQRLLRPAMVLVDRLPRRQATALRAAFGEVEGDGDRFLVFLAAFSLFAEAAEAAPFSPSSTTRSGSIKRRLRRCCSWRGGCRPNHSVAVRGAGGRFLSFDSAGLPSIAVGDLDAVAAGALLGERAGGPVPPACSSA